MVDLQPDLAVAELLPWLYLGSQDVAGDEELLRRHQITHILNVGAGITIDREQWSWRVVERRVELLDTPEQRIDTGGHQDQGVRESYASYPTPFQRCPSVTSFSKRRRPGDTTRCWCTATRGSAGPRAVNEPSRS